MIPEDTLLKKAPVHLKGRKNESGLIKSNPDRFLTCYIGRMWNKLKGLLMFTFSTSVNVLLLYIIEYNWEKAF